MTLAELKKRVVALEEDVAKIKRRLSPRKRRRTKDWRKVVGLFADDPEFDEMVRLGREYRRKRMDSY
jgi:hypothetical protein